MMKQLGNDGSGETMYKMCLEDMASTFFLVSGTVLREVEAFRLCRILVLTVKKLSSTYRESLSESRLFQT